MLYIFLHCRYRWLLEQSKIFLYPPESLTVNLKKSEFLFQQVLLTFLLLSFPCFKVSDHNKCINTRLNVTFPPTNCCVGNGKIRWKNCNENKIKYVYFLSIRNMKNNFCFCKYINIWSVEICCIFMKFSLVPTNSWICLHKTELAYNLRVPYTKIT